MRDDLFAIRTLQVEMAKYAESVGMRLHGLDGLHVDVVAQGARGMQHRAIDTGDRHLGQCFVDEKVVHLAMMTAQPAFAPDMNLRVYDQHGAFSWSMA